MRKLMIILLTALAVALTGVACGDDDDDGDASPTATGSTTTARPSRTEDPNVTPTNGDVKTPGPGESPDEATPAPTATGPAPTPAAEGTPATLIEEPNQFFSTNYPGESPSQSDCIFSPITFVVTCGGDKYAPDPPLTGEDVTCALLSIDDEPVAIRCNSQVPLQSIYYDIQE
jgi:hypothetical protein